jgi:hypothetical protein
LELRGFAPAGTSQLASQLEYWNTGTMGKDKWKQKKDLFLPLLLPIIPLLHHSNIPCGYSIIPILQMRPAIIPLLRQIPLMDNAVPQQPRRVLHCQLLESFASISYYLNVSV